MPFSLLADEDFNGRIVPGIRTHYPDIDICRVQDVGLSGHHDTTILGGASISQRVILTHDVSTMIGYAKDRTQ